MFQARAAPAEGNESELRIVLTQKNLVISPAESKPECFSRRTEPDLRLFPGNCHGRPKVRRAAFGIRLFWDYRRIHAANRHRIARFSSLPEPFLQHIQ